ncbi:hypothetical protein [Flavobacterium sp. MDT1-60]|uniref:hypothetical protein n=1 Tax=Flavobacterium sp. MDT1-60 TaxID=1979344 RepID=UPI00177EEE9A|nr:hypothetical protein [Flavobacterium sp. MDT1-60]QOG02306.1 hypothetical protein IHE43_21395 [Flavobacterium sp. MDT1-60]
MTTNDISLALSNILETDYYIDNQFSSINFDDLFTSFVFDQFELTERMDIQLIWSYYAKALNECKQNRLSKADFYYKKGLDTLNYSDLSERAKLYLNVYIYPNLAFRIYKDNDNKKALDFLLLAIENIEIIEKEYPDIYAAKIQQIHNIIRIFQKSNQTEQYNNLNVDIITHILLKTEPVKKSYNLRKVILDQTKIEYKEEMLVQIFSEFLLNQIITNSELFDFNAFCNSLNQVDANSEHKYIKDWLALVCLMDKNSLNIVPLLKTVVAKDYKFIFFKIYILQTLLNKSFLYLKTEESIQNVKLLLNSFIDLIQDKNLVEKIQKVNKIEFK